MPAAMVMGATSVLALPSNRRRRRMIQLTVTSMRRHTFLGTCLGIVALSSCACSLNAQGLRAEGTFDKTLKVSGPTDLQVQTGSGTIQIRSGAPGVVVHARVRA